MGLSKLIVLLQKMSDAEKIVWRLSEWKKSTFGREMLSRKEYKTTKDALEMFKNDELVHKPGLILCLALNLPEVTQVLTVTTQRMGTLY